MSTNEDRKDIYPVIHFTAEKNWINDPNGLVWHDGIFELYYQYNPRGIEWGNMTWGHARSRDLIHWEHLEPALFPDETGTMFSGCGFAARAGAFGFPKGTLLFPYTAAAMETDPYTHEVKAHFTIRLAYSMNGGDILIKYPGTLLQELAPDNRDPKVFYHEESFSYILVLWLHENDFGIFRSEDKKQFFLSDRVTLKGGFECPDLFCLPVKDSEGKDTGEKKWVFWEASGRYFVGDFDGYHFSQIQAGRAAYGTSLPYAAQTWSNVPDQRVISIPWLRTKCIADTYTGAMGIPRELSLMKINDTYLLSSVAAAEIKNACTPAESCAEKADTADGSKTVWDLDPETAVFINADGENDFEAVLYTDTQEEIVSFIYHCDTGTLYVTSSDTTEFIRTRNFFTKKKDVEILYDRGIVEISSGEGLSLSITDLPYLRSKRCQRAVIKASEGKFKVSTIK